MNRDFIDAYENTADRLSLAIRGLTREDLLAFPVLGTWSIQQIVVHLADTECVIADRIKRVIAEEKPSLLAFDERRWAQRLEYHEQSAQDAAAMVELTRRQIARVLRKLPDSAFDRVGVHNQAGEIRLRDLVEKAVKHMDHHLKFLIDKREKLGKIMW